MGRMSKEVWALVGVVIGALLGGGAQVLNGHLSEKRRHQQWLREQRVEVYRTMLHSLHRHMNVISDHLYNPKYAEPPPDDWAQPLESDLAMLKLFASADAVEKARAAVDAVWKLESEGGEPNPRWKACEYKVSAFRDAAKAELVS